MKHLLSPVARMPSLPLFSYIEILVNLVSELSQIDQFGDHINIFEVCLTIIFSICISLQSSWDTVHM